MLENFFKKKKPQKVIRRKSSKTKKLEWHTDYELTERVRSLVSAVEFEHIPTHRIFCFRTEGSKSRSYARIWAFPKIFQTVLDIEPAYVIEVLNKYYNRLSYDEQTKVLIHELLHIPKNFSGSLLPHAYGNKRIDTEVEKIYKELQDK